MVYWTICIIHYMWMMFHCVPLCAGNCAKNGAFALLVSSDFAVCFAFAPMTQICATKYKTNHMQDVWEAGE